MNLYNLHLFETSPVFTGAKSRDIFRGTNAPLHCSLITKISGIKKGHTITRRDNDGNILRNYQFDVFEGVEFFFLLIKGVDNFFLHQQDFMLYSIDKEWQIIPLTYRTMSMMTEDEISIVFRDIW
jgi:hypothetical protein